MTNTIRLTRFGFVSLFAGPVLAQTGRDVFLLAGQSNMAGRGEVEPADQQPLAGISVFTKERAWAPAVDPLHFDKPAIAGVGLGRTFAATVQKHGQLREIGLIPAAMGGSSLEEWSPGGKLFTNAVERTKAAGGRLRGILWHQGEADAQPGLESTYAERWMVVMTALRQAVGDVPVVVGELGRFNPKYAAVSEQLALLPVRFPRTAFVSAGGLRAKADGVHFDAPSLREFGRRYGHGWLMLTGNW
jgi:hypothetical protein